MRQKIKIAYRKCVPGMFKKEQQNHCEEKKQSVCSSVGEKMFYTFCNGKKYIFPESVVKERSSLNWNLC